MSHEQNPNRPRPMSVAQHSSTDLGHLSVSGNPVCHVVRISFPSVLLGRQECVEEKKNEYFVHLCLSSSATPVVCAFLTVCVPDDAPAIHPPHPTLVLWR
jgi:hypothetical protein